MNFGEGSTLHPRYIHVYNKYLISVLFRIHYKLIPLTFVKQNSELEQPVVKQTSARRQSQLNYLRMKYLFLKHFASASELSDL